MPPKNGFQQKFLKTQPRRWSTQNKSVHACFQQQPITQHVLPQGIHCKKLLLNTLGARKPHRKMLLLPLLVLLFLVPSFCLVLQTHGHSNKIMTTKNINKYIYILKTWVGIQNIQTKNLWHCEFYYTWCQKNSLQACHLCFVTYQLWSFHDFWP